MTPGNSGKPGQSGESVQSSQSHQTGQPSQSDQPGQADNAATGNDSVVHISDVDMNEVLKYLSRRDKTLGAFIKKVGPCTLSGQRTAAIETHFESIVFAIIAQQLSGKAADTISLRLKGLAGDPVTPESIAKLSTDELRSVGLSGAKTKTIIGLTSAVLDGDLDLDALYRMTDQQVHDALTALWGIGRWTAEMTMIFQLGRLDVWPTGDLAVRKGWGIINRLDAPPTADELEEVANHLSPYRSIVAWYCWRATDETSLIW